MSGKIFLIKEDNELIEMEEETYVSEDVLQDIIANYPNLLAGEQIDEKEPRKWLLIQREQVLPYNNGSKVFYLDHLFLDQDGIPTIVETKRSSDNRLRREVVAQMLDYASNALIYLPVEEIKNSLETNYPDKDQEELLKEKLGLDITPEEFWENVKINYKAGKIRLIFVADFIPVELATIVEFLNKQMDPAEVFAIEVKQYTRDDLKTLVPTIVGQTAQERMRKNYFSTEKLNETTFFENLDETEAALYRKLLDFARENHLKINWGSKSFSINIAKDNNNINILRGYCKLSSFGQFLFATAGSISQLENGSSILKEYEVLDDFTKKVSDGYSFNLKELDKDQLNRLMKVIEIIIYRINSESSLE